MKILKVNQSVFNLIQQILKKDVVFIEKYNQIAEILKQHQVVSEHYVATAGGIVSHYLQLDLPVTEVKLELL